MSNKNSDSNKTTVNTGIGFTGLLTIVFIVLKLIGVIEWSWLWVLSPLWIPLAFSVVILCIMGLVLLFLSLFEKDKQ